MSGYPSLNMARLDALVELVDAFNNWRDESARFRASVHGPWPGYGALENHPGMPRLMELELHLQKCEQSYGKAYLAYVSAVGSHEAPQYIQ